MHIFRSRKPQTFRNSSKLVRVSFSSNDPILIIISLQLFHFFFIERNLRKNKILAKHWSTLKRRLKILIYYYVYFFALKIGRRKRLITVDAGVAKKYYRVVHFEVCTALVQNLNTFHGRSGSKIGSVSSAGAKSDGA